jgi:hypothetical protein
LNATGTCFTLLIVKETTIGFRTSAELKEAATNAAEAERRTLAAICEIALIEYLERRGEWPPRAKGRRRASAPTQPLGRAKRG